MGIPDGNAVTLNPSHLGPGAGEPIRYEFRVRGPVPENAAETFPELEAVMLGRRTVFYGTVIDEAQPAGPLPCAGRLVAELRPLPHCSRGREGWAAARMRRRSGHAHRVGRRLPEAPRPRGPEAPRPRVKMKLPVPGVDSPRSGDGCEVFLAQR